MSRTKVKCDCCESEVSDHVKLVSYQLVLREISYSTKTIMHGFQNYYLTCFTTTKNVLSTTLSKFVILKSQDTFELDAFPWEPVLNESK